MGVTDSSPNNQDKKGNVASDGPSLQETKTPFARQTQSSKALDLNYLDKFYNPDEQSPSESVNLQGFIESLFVKDKDQPGRGAANPGAAGIESARIIEVNGWGEYRVRELSSTEELREAIRRSDEGWTRFKKIMESGVKLREAGKSTDAERKLLRENFDGGDTDQVTVTGPFASGNDFQEYLPMMGGPFSKQLYLFDYLDMHRKCLSGNTKIPLLDGTSPTIKEMAERGGSFWVYACKDGIITPARAIEARKTGTRPTVEVELDNGEKVICTEDHPFLLRSGEYRDAGQLESGDSLMPLYRRASRRNPKNYEQIYHPWMDLWEDTHRLVARTFLREKYFTTPTRHVDHINEKRWDNSPENIQVMTRRDHLIKTTGSDAHRERSRKQWLGKPKSAEVRAKIGEANRRTWQDPEVREKRLAGMRANNHKVVSVRKGGFEDVYDLSVPFFHNFAIGQGVFVHNCFEAWNHNPVAHQGVKIITHFVLGRGVSWKACHPQCQDAFDKWANELDLNHRLETWSDSLTRDGELMIRKFINPMTKQLFLRWLDPSTIWEIITDLEDIERVFFYHQQFPTQYQVLYGTGTQGGPFKTQNYDSTKYVINQIPADEVIHIKINVAPNEKRGRSDLFSVLGWLKRYKDFWNARVLRAIVQSTFAWKNKIKGSDADVQTFINQFGNQQPNFGSVWVENEASELTPMTVDMGSGAVEPDAAGVINMIATGLGIPKEYLGFGDHSARASAIVSSEPGAKKFQARQLLLGRLLNDIAEHWFEQEIKAGRLPAQMPKDDADLPTVLRWVKKNRGLFGGIFEKVINALMGREVIMAPHEARIEFQFPEIAIEDRSAKLKDIESVYLAGFMTKARAAKMSTKELGVEDFNWDDEQEEMGAEKESAAADYYAQATPPQGPQQPPRPAPGVVSGVPGQEQPPQDPQQPPKPSGGLSSQERKAVKTNDRR